MIYACISDVHGRGYSFIECLKAVEYFRQNTKKEVKVVLLGDYCDRGTNNLLVLDTIIDYVSKYPDTIVLRGNHEEFITGSLNWPRLAKDSELKNWHSGPRSVLNCWASVGNGGNQTLNELLPYFKLANSENIDERREGQINIDRYVDFVTNLPDRWLEGNFIFTHAPLKGYVYDENEDLDTIPSTEVLWNIDLDLDNCNEWINIHGHVHIKKNYCSINRRSRTVNVATFPKLSVTFIDSEKDLKDDDFEICNYFCLDEKDIDIYDDNAPQASKKAANFAKWLLMSKQIGK